MSAEQEVAAPAQLARFEVVSPWQGQLRSGVARRWLTWLAEAWREGMELYVRAALLRAHSGGPGL